MSDLFEISNQLKALINTEIGSLETSVFCSNVNYQQGVRELHNSLNKKREALSEILILGDKDKEKAILKEARDLIDHFNRKSMSDFE